ncbi:hypothetical protein [Marivita geojedonensis]|uniref:Uncharacterized protein n=1 Tax=Marivita geojedonensis TaxID=1123756 RepID=A0A1X4NCY5_9RHOB|nr:hypothetical protein [Marivita geojedonensis]OSQ44640.1 hypothetical protein MGEO_18650 [Marivita geojedonensis]PRY76421.1 hypothetical protein CLV76_11141 [Marivita geojedonensis]
MSTMVEDLAEKLADDTLKAMKHLNNDRFFMEVAAELGAASTTLEEAYLTAIRVRLAERKARAFIRARIESHQRGEPQPEN